MKIDPKAEVTPEMVQGFMASYGVEEEDLKRIYLAGEVILPRLDEYIDLFYQWLQGRVEWLDFMSNPETVNRLKRSQKAHWISFFGGKVDIQYIQERRLIGRIHAEIGLGLPSYFSAMTRFFDLFTSELDDILILRSISRLIHLDTALTVDSYNSMTTEVITEQSRALSDMSSPVSQVWDGVLLLPIVGLMDSRRAQELMQNMLARIESTQATEAILDISGVAVVDTAVANHLIKITKASKLMGCRCIISGISPAIAQTMVELGIEVNSIITTSSLKGAMEVALTGIGLRITESK